MTNERLPERERDCECRCEGDAGGGCCERVDRRRAEGEADAVEPRRLRTAGTKESGRGVVLRRPGALGVVGDALRAEMVGDVLRAGGAGDALGAGAGGRGRLGRGRPSSMDNARVRAELTSSGSPSGWPSVAPELVLSSVSAESDLLPELDAEEDEREGEDGGSLDGGRSVVGSRTTPERRARKSEKRPFLVSSVAGAAAAAGGGGSGGVLRRRKNEVRLRSGAGCGC